MLFLWRSSEAPGLVYDVGCASRLLSTWLELGSSWSEPAQRLELPRQKGKKAAPEDDADLKVLEKMKRKAFASAGFT